MSRRTLGGVMLAVLGVALLWAGYSWWRAWSAPLVQVVFRPAFSVEGVDSGTPVRVKGVTVGHVSSVGLELDQAGELRPVLRLSLDPMTLEDRGFADRLRTAQLHVEVAKGLRARLVAVSPASGLLQVELIWVPGSPLVAGLARDEIPSTGGTFQRTLDEFVRKIELLAERDLTRLAAELTSDLDDYHRATDPERAQRFSAALVERTARLASPEGTRSLAERSAGLTAACTRLREAVERADRALDDETVALLQVRLADAAAALGAFTAALEGSQEKMDAAAGELTTVFRAVAELARQWSKKAAGLTTEPRPR